MPRRRVEGEGEVSGFTSASPGNGAALAPHLPCPRPARVVLAGRYVRLEPIDPARHAADLFQATCRADAPDLYRYLFAEAPHDVAAMAEWARAAATSDDPRMFAAVDVADDRARGRQALMRVVPEHGVVEVGHVLWGRGIARTRLATESIALLARYVFEELGYRRFEWKCNDRNAASKRAALRFGFTFEGVFRQHMWVRGANRDTAWFAMLDRDWRDGLRAGYERWLDPANFDAQGRQRRSLAHCLARTA
jgi:RimJ/RimL family protein N-acetyltransferase